MNVVSIPQKDLQKMTVYCFDVLLNHFNKDYKLVKPTLSQSYIAYPMFITVNNPSNSAKLRGCIGTFEKDTNKTIFDHLQEYTIQSAFYDSRFAGNHITQQELVEIELSVSLLDDDKSTTSINDWTIGTDGIKISFTNNNRTHRGTFLPEVATEQEWDKQTTIEKLIKKTGYYGQIDDDFLKTITLLKYASNKYAMTFLQFKEYKKRSFATISPIPESVNTIAQYLTYFGISYLILFM